MAIVVGLHAFGHEAGACVATPDGIWALSEERLSRQKYDGGFPSRSLDWALGAAGVGALRDVDLVVFDLIEDGASRVLAALRERDYLGAVHACRHHDAHAASAFFASPFDDAAVLTVDAGGSRERETGPGLAPSPQQPSHPDFREVQARYRGHGHRLHTLRRTVVGPPYSVNPGVLYGLAAAFLGCGELGAGKVMGLAAYGRADRRFRTPLFELFDGDHLAACPFDDPLGPRSVSRYLPELFDGVAPIASTAELTDRHRDVAAHVQQQTSDAVLYLVKHLVSVTRTPRLCIAGGYGLNVLTNRRILQETSVRELFVQPAATDCGIPLGCALWGLHQVLGEPRQFRMETAALGGAYGEVEIERALADVTGLVVKRQRVVGWFQGRSEFGPRALGHRSLLADPRDARTTERLNAEIKHREPFRPYAPITLLASADRYFELPAPSPFMLLAADVRPTWRQRLPAITHVDGTARVQTVDPALEPRLARALTAFEAEAGVAVMLNTSFNRAEEPIVERPQDALDMLLHSGLDALAMEDYWIEKAP
jgi:carbamoyltransferase